MTAGQDSLLPVLLILNSCQVTEKQKHAKQKKVAKHVLFYMWLRLIITFRYLLFSYRATDFLTEPTALPLKPLLPASPREDRVLSLANRPRTSLASPSSSSHETEGSFRERRARGVPGSLTGHSSPPGKELHKARQETEENSEPGP